MLMKWTVTMMLLTATIVNLISLTKIGTEQGHWLVSLLFAREFRQVSVEVVLTRKASGNKTLLILKL